MQNYEQYLKPDCKYYEFYTFVRRNMFFIIYPNFI